MSGDVHVRFCEGLGVRFPRATRQVWWSPLSTGLAMTSKDLELPRARVMGLSRKD